MNQITYYGPQIRTFNRAMNQANRVGLGEYIFYRSTLYERIREYYQQAWNFPIPEDIFSKIVRALPPSNAGGWWNFEEDVAPIVTRKEYAPDKSTVGSYQKSQAERVSTLARQQSEAAVQQAQQTVGEASAAAIAQKEAADAAEKSRRNWQIAAGVAVVGAVILYAMSRKK